MPFSPYGLECADALHAPRSTSPARRPIRKDPKSPRVGKVTHPSGAPDNHLLTVWSPGPVDRHATASSRPAIDAGIYLIKAGKPIDEPGQMLLIKNDPKYNEQWPRALVPYKRIYGVDEPARLPAAGQRRQAVAAPARRDAVRPGRHVEPVQARELSRTARVPEGSVTATYAGGSDPFQGSAAAYTRASAATGSCQGADAGLYDNSDIHAIRILATEPTTDPRCTGKSAALLQPSPTNGCASSARFPVRKFSRRAASSRSIPTATPTPASWPRSPPTSPGRSRRSTRTAWC